MIKKYLEGSHAIAETIKNCNPKVICAYPITPQTHIVERLAEFVANGELEAEFVNVESEHSAASVVLGAAATGVRTYTSTSSQGLLLMAEVLFNIAGLRLPVVLTCVNRAVSAPINIWNDHQDSMSVRDSGFMQFYAENIQEACDLHILAYRLAEDKDIMLPAMVCMDGYILSHGYEVVEIIDKDEIAKFLPPYEPPYKLDVENPLTMGLLADPSYYMETRLAIEETMKLIKDKLPNLAKEFEKIYKRQLITTVETYRLEDAEKAIVAMGSLSGTIKDTVDAMRSEGHMVGMLKIVCYRPFPGEEIYQALKDVAQIAVLEKAISLGAQAGPLFLEISTLFRNKKATNKISGFIAGLGGRDIKPATIREVFQLLKEEESNLRFVDLHKWYQEPKPLLVQEAKAEMKQTYKND